MINLSSSMKKQIKKGVAILKEGGLVAYPTDTVYGLGASANLPEAVARVYTVKQRPRNMPLPLLLANKSQIRQLANPIPAVAWLLIDKFLPGALTIILPKSDSAPEGINEREHTIAIRIPAHPVPIALIEGLEAPIVGTSANLSRRPSPLIAEDVRSQLGDSIDLIIDGGQCPGGKESTVVDVTDQIPEVLREGAISAEEVEKVCGNIILRKRS